MPTQTAHVLCLHVSNERLFEDFLEDEECSNGIQAVYTAMSYAENLDGLNPEETEDNIDKEYFLKYQKDQQLYYDAGREILTSYFKSINLVVNISNYPKDFYVRGEAHLLLNEQENNIEVFKSNLRRCGFPNEDIENYLKKYCKKNAKSCI